jgi:hypothetical protein
VSYFTTSHDCILGVVNAVLVSVIECLFGFSVPTENCLLCPLCYSFLSGIYLSIVLSLLLPLSFPFLPSHQVRDVLLGSLVVAIMIVEVFSFCVCISYFFFVISDISLCIFLYFNQMSDNILAVYKCKTTLYMVFEYKTSTRKVN